jgi:DNA-binding transcriptional MerR regulator
VVGGWKLVELAQLAGVSPRTITEYLGRGLLTAPEFRGTSTRYEREHLVRLMGIRLCKLDGLRQLKAIKQKLEILGSREIEAWIASRELPPQARAALGLAAPAPQAPAEPWAAEASPGDRAFGETWTRLELLPGLELSVQASASALAHKAARHLAGELKGWIVRALADNESRATVSGFGSQ